MTEYHPVTKEELEQIRKDCSFPHRKDCEECKCCGSDDTPFTCINELWDKVLSRPDPLTLLEAWLRYMHKLDGISKNEPFYLYLGDVVLMFKQLRTNPEAVREQGIKEGWWKE